jgi:hypothetical protein
MLNNIAAAHVSVSARPPQVWVDDLQSIFGIRAVEVDSALPPEWREQSMRACFEAFGDLIEIVKMPARFASLGGRLSIVMGATQPALPSDMTHFQPGRWQLHLTHTSGAGSLAHEFGHALDHFIAQRNWRPMPTAYSAIGFASQYNPGYKLPLRHGDKPIIVAMQHWQKLHGLDIEAYWKKKFSAMVVDARKKDSLSAPHKTMWSSHSEVFARCFEAYVHDELQSKGKENHDLVFALDVQSQEVTPSSYPAGDLRRANHAAMRSIMDSCAAAWRAAPQNQTEKHGNWNSMTRH